MFDLSSPTVYIPTIFVALVAIFASIFYKDAKKIVKKNTKDLPYYTEISLSMGSIDRNILENGRFVTQQFLNHLSGSCSSEFVSSYCSLLCFR